MASIVEEPTKADAGRSKFAEDLPDLAAILPKVKLIETDGEPLETLWHFAAIALLLDSIHFHLRERSNYFAGGNMFVYFSEEQARHRDYRGPDFFFVDEVDGGRERKWWAVWEENGRYPDLIIELLSPTTAQIDRTVKKELYERTFRTPDYFIYDPETEKLTGWRLGAKGRYQSIHPDKQGRLWSEQLQLSLGPWRGSYQRVPGVFPRFFTPQGEIILTSAEGAREQAHAQTERAEAEAKRADAQAERADTEAKRADTEAKRADAQAKRAEQAEAELAKIKARLTKTEGRETKGSR